ncbi:MAG: RNA polymerase subunit sigma-70 [SAR86 cluster bacterium]|uniref:RNA polymerase subunit sigma-70 n=1 Tax=SAR86 cluster bacterium TaxID=2030880 RepID=A0A2A4X6W5_9GAMM|nr:MAG: RNA polymerase subunit sigma-70 [SAR86 cluster bacterium]
MQNMKMNAGTLWEQFHGELYGFLITRVNSDATAQDILQSAFLRAHKQLTAGNIPEQPRAWLYQIARNLIVDSHRRAGRQQSLADKVAAEPTSAELADNEGDAFSLVARMLPMFIEQLDAPYRDALQMTELEGLTQGEAAASSGISLSGMKSRIQRGRKKVYDSLEQCCAFELDARGHMIACVSRTRTSDCC